MYSTMLIKFMLGKIFKILSEKTCQFDKIVFNHFDVCLRETLTIDWAEPSQWFGLAPAGRPFFLESA